jgi:peptide methionine sulfoxide reductase MsrB
MTSKKLFVSAEDYKVMAGPDWPSYPDYLNDVVAKKPEIQEEIDQYTVMMRKDGIKFPINTKTACQSKWTWSTIYLNQLSTASCHRVNPIKFELEDFDNFHNIPKKLDDRRLMLNGEWPQGGCEYCKTIEDAGGWSDRQHNLDIRGLTPPELEFDPTAIEVTPRIVEIFAQNTCNFSCVYCNSNLSSKIEQENIKFGAFHQNGVNIPIVTNSTKAADEYFVKFIAWLEKNIQVLRRLHLLGGETLIQHDLMTSVLDILERNPNPDLEFCVFSNLNAPERYWKLYLNRIEDLQKAGNIKCFDLTASIDCWGPAAEYVRYGLDLDKFEERLAWASEQGDWLRVNINQTVTAMTVRTMPDLIAVVNKYNQHKHIGHYFQFYTGEQMFQHPQIFEYSTWSDDFQRIFELMPTATGNQQEAIPRMQGLQKQLQQVHKTDWVAVEKLQIYLDEIDRRRKTNWRNIFSYLDVSNQD